MKNLLYTFFRENFLLTGDTKVKYWSYSMGPDLLFEILRNRPVAGHSPEEKHETFWQMFPQNFSKSSYGAKSVCKLFFGLFRITEEHGLSLTRVFWFPCELKKLTFSEKKSHNFVRARQNHLLFSKSQFFF